jgi:hypothetical protein
MNVTRAVAVAWLLAAGLAAQAGQGEAKPNASTAEYQKLVADYKAAQTAYSAARKQVEASPEFKAADEAKDRAKMQELVRAVPPVDRRQFAERAMESADRFTGDGAVPFLCWAAVNGGDKDITRTAVERLMKDHVRSPDLLTLVEGNAGMILARQMSADEADAALARVVEGSPHALVKAWAMYHQGTKLAGRNASAEDKEKGQKLLDEAEKLAKGTDLALRIAGPRFVKERLQIGMIAPDIQGEDLDGVPFKLSDYRGKVVVLDFWGFW